MKHFLLAASLLFSTAALLACDTEDDCGNPFGCKDNSATRMTSSEVGELIGVDEATIAIALDEEGYTPHLDEQRDELLYALTSDDLDELAQAVE